MVEILIGGDICPINRNMPYFINGDAKTIFNDLLPEFERSDVSIVNLESPLIKKEKPILKSGRALGVAPDCINGITGARITIANLANNHILDHGPDGLLHTISVCRKAGLSIVGAGKHLESAKKILIHPVKDIRIGILACAEHEFSIATDSSPGANPLSIIDFVRSVKDHKDKFDYLIVLLHGGKEHYAYPSPELQNTCRFMVEEGANAVICQHSHCPGAYEEYKGGHIVYGQGNLIFDPWTTPPEAWHRGYLVNLSVSRNASSKMRIIPYYQSDACIGARKMNSEEATKFFHNIQQKSDMIKDSRFVKQQWEKFCNEKRYTYFSILRGHNRLFRYLNRLFHFSDIFYSKEARVTLQNVIRCESHREVLQTILSKIRK